jgi:hypothetical protein
MIKFNFSYLQNSLIAFQNAEKVSAFEYFDEKNRDRVQKIRACILDQKDDLNQVETIMGLIKECVDKNGNILDEFEGVWKSFEDHKNAKELEFNQNEFEDQKNLFDTDKMRVRKSTTKKFTKKKK